ncbi:hypothetical protein NVS55_24980 [Myxococcus stipitatus]|uniref:hypothetical protein n=1 Tax=Myxococcus stipitatus TaxID=83455 RepID=UPI003144F2AE
MIRWIVAMFFLLFTACSSPPPKEPEAPTRTAADVLGVGTDFMPKYTVASTERFDFTGTPRLSMRVTVPSGLSRMELEANLRHALLRAYESGPVQYGAVSVLAYSSTKTDGAFDAASADFAPGGKWSEASKDVPLSKWRVHFTFADSYFQERKPLSVGTRAILVLSMPGVAKTVALSSKANRWLDEDILARLSPSTPVLIVDQADFGIVGVRYEVETTTGKKHRGWVHASALKVE